MEDGVPAMNTAKDLLPSFIYARFKNNDGEVSVNYEGLLIELLSRLSTLEEVAPQFKSSLSDETDNSQEFDIITWISKFIYENLSIDDSGINRAEGILIYEWSMALVYIRDLLKCVSPFELHFIASQSIYVSESSSLSHRIICLVLCTHSLRQCPELREKRWRRWQSLICETLRIFQDSIQSFDDSRGGTVDSGKWAFSLMTNHIVPSCLLVINRLPLESTYHVAIFSGLVGTSSNILEKVLGRCHEELSKGANDADSVVSHFQESVCVLHDNIQLIIQCFDRFDGLSAHAIWIESMLQPVDKVVDRKEDVDFLMHRNDLSWWIHHRESHEPEHRVANMDTSFHKIGLGHLAMKAFEERPMVYHPSFLWAVWSPHVASLFSNARQCPYIQRDLSYRFLESLVRIIDKESMLPEKTIIGSAPGAHLELFQLLSDQLMSRIKPMDIMGDGNLDEKINSSTVRESDFDLHSQRTVALIKALLTRFTTASQVQMIEKVMQDCSSPGLKARFLDLLRPLILISDSQTNELLWGVLVSIVDNLFQKFWNREEQILIEVVELINRDVEISVGAITMIQMWSLARGKEFNDNQIVLRENLEAFRVALRKQLASWSEDISLAPEFHFRLFLLDSALENTVQSLSR